MTTGTCAFALRPRRAPQLGPALRPGLRKARAADVMAKVRAPYIYSTFTVDLGWTPSQYELWLAHAMPQLVLRPELLSDPR